MRDEPPKLNKMKLLLIIKDKESTIPEVEIEVDELKSWFLSWLSAPLAKGQWENFFENKVLEKISGHKTKLSPMRAGGERV